MSSDFRILQSDHPDANCSAAKNQGNRFIDREALRARYGRRDIIRWSERQTSQKADGRHVRRGRVPPICRCGLRGGPSPAYPSGAGHVASDRHPRVSDSFRTSRPTLRLLWNVPRAPRISTHFSRSEWHPIHHPYSAPNNSHRRAVHYFCTSFSKASFW